MSNPSNRNYASGFRFKFNIDRCPNVEFFTQAVTTPDMRIGFVEQGTTANKYKHPGDELYYGDLLIKFIVDEDMKNYNEIAQWLRFITNPFSNEFCNSAYIAKYGEAYESNASLMILNSHFNANVTMIYRDIYPIYLSGLMFDSSYTDEQYPMAEANFKVNLIDMYDKNSLPMWLQA